MRNSFSLPKNKAIIAFIAVVALGPSSLMAAIKAEEKLKDVRSQIKKYESLINSEMRNEAKYGQEIERLEKLMRLQALEIELSKAELIEIETEISEMDQRKASLKKILDNRKAKLREHLSRVYSLKFAVSFTEATRRKQAMRSMHKKLIDTMVLDEKTQIFMLKEIELELIQMEEETLEKKQELIAQVDDLRQKQSVLQLNIELKNKRLQKSRLSKNSRLKQFQEAKLSERKLSNTMVQLRQRREKLKKKWASNFLAHKGNLDLPLEGRIVTKFGKRYDPKTNLYSFHKGISIATQGREEVKAIFPGKVVFSGRLGGYRQLIIIDHGKDYFSLVAQLGELISKVGDQVQAGDVVGKSGVSGSPVYFEIRKRHVAIDPLPWLKL